MALTKRNVSLADIIFITISSTRDWQLMFVGNDNFYILDRTLVPDLLRILKITPARFRNMFDNDRVEFMERRAFSMPNNFTITFTFNKNEILGVREFKPAKPDKEDDRDELDVFRERLYEARWVCGVALACLIWFYYIFLYPS